MGSKVGLSSLGSILNMMSNKPATVSTTVFAKLVFVFPSISLQFASRTLTLASLKAHGKLLA